ncbi:flavin-containing monooxygenase [Mycobacterium sp. pUA109]|uniref:flavin-containing monooxygenase n=1 Tax=Mycobacterium sp. pUA109 TaxID=3238982 RepID=UPI00351B82B3
MTTAIIGAGFSGLGAAIKLVEAGIEDIVVLERAGEIGGTWRDNTYPGVACDVPSLLYSYSFEQNPLWSQTFASGAEIQQYLIDVVAKHDVRKYIRFNETVRGIRWEGDESGWIIRTDHATYRARTVIASYGPLANASLPRIEGIDTFSGKILHTARWDHTYDFKGKTVAVIGTGATAVQVIPELVQRAKQVRVFQRTAGWVFPRANTETSQQMQWMFTRMPAVQRLLRSAILGASDAAALALVWNTVLTSLMQVAAKRYLAKEVKDPWLRRRLTPNFRPGCKRMLVSSDYYPALQADNCELVTWPIARINETGVMTCEGVERTADVIVCATGYEVTKAGPPIEIVGRDGRSLNDEWRKGAFAYKSVNVAGYPNLFFTFGPNAGPGHISALVYMEAEIDYAVRTIQLMRTRHLTSIEVRADAQRDYNRWVQRRLAKTTWNSGGCSSWYLTEDGFNATMFPGFASTFRKMLKDIELHDYTATGDVAAALASVEP